MAQLQRWDPDTFLALMRETVPDYERLQDETVAATGTDAQRVLELGTGTGETAQRVLARHPAAVLVGLDASSKILDRARAALPPLACSCALHASKTRCPKVRSTWSSPCWPSTTSTAWVRRSCSGAPPTASHQTDGSSSAILSCPRTPLNS